MAEKQQNKYEKLFDSFMKLVEFGLIKHKSEKDPNWTDEEICLNTFGIWSVYDYQGANLGDINSDRLRDASDIFERMDIYIYNYIDEYLKNKWVNKLGYSIKDVPDTIEGWLNHKKELKKYQDRLDLIDMICHHADDINLENCHYEEEN